MRNRQYRRLKWPTSGVDLGRAFDDTRSGTCVDAMNVRSWDPRTGRMRGAQRAGLSRYVLDSGGDSKKAQNASGAEAVVKIQDINQIITSRTAASITIAVDQLQNSNYVSVCVAGGVPQKFTRNSDFTVISGTTLSATAPVIFSAQLFFDLFYADGVSTLKYDGSANAMATWTPTAGSLPGSGSARWRLVENWRSRIVLSGVREDPHNWFMSALGDPLDWDYAPTPSRTTQAVAGNNAVAGKTADLVNSMCPYDDDTLLFFGDHSIWQMTGDPAEGGRLDLLSDITGAPFGRPWCKGPQGEIYFFGQRGGIYTLSLGSKPRRISAGRLEERLQTFNLNTSLVRAIYDDHTQGVHFFVTSLDDDPTDAAKDRLRGTHLFYDLRTEAFWFDEFVDPNMDPLSVHVQEGDSAEDRATLLGGRDGYLRYIDYDGKNDDTEAIHSHVYIGPLFLEEARKFQLRELIGILDENSDSASYTIFAADTPQAAFDSAVNATGLALEGAQEFFVGSWRPGRNVPDRRRASGKYIFIRLNNYEYNETWSYESAYAYLVSSGLSRLREA